MQDRDFGPPLVSDKSETMNTRSDIETTQSDHVMEGRFPGQPVNGEDPEGLDAEGGYWGDYPIDDLLIRTQSRTIFEVYRRIEQGAYVMSPDFQRDFIWDEKKQSKLIESVIMRIPLPVFYMAEDDEGRVVVVDGLQRLFTFQRFLNNNLKLQLPDRQELNGKRFSDLESRLKNRIEDFNLTFYTIDSTVPEQARLDIFDRVNSGEPLSRQQMRNCLFMGKATSFLKEEARTDIFLRATGRSLNQKTMRDREMVNRFCAFQLLPVASYRGDMDIFLADCLRKMNKMDDSGLSRLSHEFQNGLANNYYLFRRHAFRKHDPNHPRKEWQKRSVLNASFWDVMSTGLSHYTQEQVQEHAEPVRQAIYKLLGDRDFQDAITYSPNSTKRVKLRFEKTRRTIEEILGAGIPAATNDSVTEVQNAHED